ncbi:Isoamyl acetate-hydrolyzing esterase 1 -like protein [Halotydeus destructor]|nr:Isoamyl acetate-hydrolyzing esterase 1 -like protein [Halotydeus destructor]
MTPMVKAVPVDEYRQNLKDIVHFMTERGLEKDKIILMTPPPFHAEEFIKSFARHRSEQFRTVGPPLRTGQLAEEYALNCAQVGHELQLDTVDLHTIFTQDSRGTQLFSDGLHFSGDGSKLLFDSIWPLVEKKVLKHTGQSSLTMKFPNWSELASH